MMKFNHRHLRSAGIPLIVALTAGATSAFAAVYAVKDLGELTNVPSRNNAKPNAISSDGRIAASNATNGEYRAFLYAGGWTNLGTLGGAESLGSGVNRFGAVVGRSVTGSGATRAFLWTPGGTDGVAGNPQMKDLGTFSGGTDSGAEAINDNNQITGYAQRALTPQAPTDDHAFRYSNGTMTDIGSLLPPSRPNSYGVGINGAGHIAGIAYDAFFTWPSAFYYNGSTAVDIGTLGSPSASAVAISSSDQIAGYSATSNFFDHAFRYAGGVMQDLGTLGGNYSYAVAINNSNVIVGGSFIDAGNSIYHAFVVSSNSMADLNDQLDATGKGWTLVEARGINDSGQIIGVGQTNGVNHVFRLDPLPEITSVKLNGPNCLVSFRTINTASYAVLYRTDLTTGTWSILTSGIMGTGGIVTATNSMSSSSQCFYRVSFSPP